jgi:hypothetical protein
LATANSSINPNDFRKMAHGDLSGFRDLAFDFFNDTRLRMTGWLALLEAGDLARFRDELHRCKGGASLFGMERLVSLIASWEFAPDVKTIRFDLNGFEKELSDAEAEVLAITDDT